jgi:hypothetical protein
MAADQDVVQSELDKEAAQDTASMDGPLAFATPDAMSSDEQAQKDYLSGVQKGCVDKLMQDFVVRETWRRPYELLWWQLYILFMSGQVAAKTPVRSKIFIPICYQIIESAVPKLVSFLSDNDSQFDVKPTDIKEQQIADNIKHLLQDQLKKSDFNRKYEWFVKQLCMYGTSYFFVDWKVKYAWVYERVPKTTVKVDENGINIPTTDYVWEKNYKVIERRPELTFLDVLDVYPAQDYATVEEQPGIFIRKFMNKDEFAANCEGDHPYFANLSQVQATGTSNRYQETRQWRKTARGEISTVQSSQVELIEYWGPYDLDGSGNPCECQIVIANRTVVVRAVPNPYHHQKRPLVKVCFTNVPGEWFGLGLLEPVISLQNELNTVRRQRLDNINLCINRMWKVLSTADIDVDKLVSQPGGVILTDDMAALEALAPQEVTQSAFTDAEKIAQDMFNATIPQNLTGSIDDLKGTGSGSVGVGALQASITQAMEKFATAGKNILEDGIKKVLELFYQLDLQYLDNAEILKAFYGDIFPRASDNSSLTTPAMIRGQVNFDMTVLSEMLNKDKKINAMTSFLSQFMSILAPQSQETILKQLWELQGFDGDEITIAPAAAPGGMPGASGSPALPGLPGGAPPAIPGMGPRGGLPPGTPSNKVPMTLSQTAAAGAAIAKQAGNGMVNPPGSLSVRVA